VNFFVDCAWGADVRGEILVFDGGHWEKSEELFNSVKAASFDDLVLPDALGEELQTDLPRFFAARETYERYGVPWKRGVLLIGPPGNGKTHAVKAMVNKLNAPCLYVKSLESRDGEHASIRKVFVRARHNQPCLVVLEDIDSLITDKNRSIFLNELDGFASNTGVVVIATTNHPERLDPSILDRPSRFDRKFYFEPPGTEERLRYARRWNDALQAEMRLDEKVLAEVVALTEGFSFAYMKELFISAMMEWINSPGLREVGAVMLERVARLREQMSRAKGEKTKKAGAA
jgi:SpoVK/Ycf46/Vps4 family AAA+-type ATPase